VDEGGDDTAWADAQRGQDLGMAGSHARLSPHRDAPPPTAVLGGDFLHGQNRALVELGRLIDRSKSRDGDGYFHPLRFPAPFHTVIINKENGGCFHHGETLLQAGGPRSISRRNGKDASPSLADSSPRSAHTAALRHHSIAHRHRLLHLEGATHGIDGARWCLTPREKDEHNRPDATLEALARLKPAFRPDGTISPPPCASRDGGLGLGALSSSWHAAMFYVKHVGAGGSLLV
jgi:hypothetical protein